LISLTTIEVYAGGGDDGNDGDGNKQKAEDNSAAAIADSDDYEVEQAGFDCIAIAANDVEIETAEEESATLTVCKVVEGSQEFEPEDFTLEVVEGARDLHRVAGQPPPACEEERIPVSPGEYTVTDQPNLGVPGPDRVEVEGDCVQDPTNPLRATGEIQEGESQTCTFINIYEDGGNS
jgi:hypothetical protein